MYFFFSSRRRHTRYIGDWSSDVCSSDLDAQRRDRGPQAAHDRRRTPRVRIEDACGRAPRAHAPEPAADAAAEKRLTVLTGHAGWCGPCPRRRRHSHRTATATPPKRTLVAAISRWPPGVCSPGTTRFARLSGASRIAATRTRATSSGVGPPGLWASKATRSARASPKKLRKKCTRATPANRATAVPANLITRQALRNRPERTARRRPARRRSPAAHRAAE